MMHSVCDSATEFLARTAGIPANGTIPDVTNTENKRIIKEVVSIDAAYAINCVTKLNTHLIAACRQSATQEHILTTIKIASAVKNMAGKKVEEAAIKVMGSAIPNSSVCGCNGDEKSAAKTMETNR